MNKSLTYFVADVHLGLEAMNPAAREGRFVEFLRGIDAERTEAVYLLGDIWDFWYEYHDVVPKGYARVFAALLDLMDAGVNVYFFDGNHDAWSYHYFEELGMKRLVQPAEVKIGSKVFCLGHGDGLGPAPFGYKLMRAVFHWRPAQVLFSSLPASWAFSLARSWSRGSRLAHNERYSFRGAEEPVYKFAEEFSKHQHVDCFVFGHYHYKVDETLPSGSRFIILRDWMEGSPYLCYNSATGEFIFG